MKKVTIRIRQNPDTALEDMGKRFIKTWKTGRSIGNTLEFESPAALFRALTPRRWELVERLQRTGPISMRGLARELERDVKRVHEDIHELMEYGLVARTRDGKFEVPYDLIHTEFDLRSVA
ncbi:MAG: transcriptional regulator [Gammaproteobacteria bacterium]